MNITLTTSARNDEKGRELLKGLGVPCSNLNTEIGPILKEEGDISAFKPVDENKTRKMLRVFLKYPPDRRSVITGVKRISRPGARAYLGSTDIRPVVGGLGISILTTPKGLMSGRAARKAKIGGELLCEAWYQCRVSATNRFRCRRAAKSPSTTPSSTP